MMAANSKGSRWVRINPTITRQIPNKMNKARLRFITLLFMMLDLQQLVLVLKMGMVAPGLILRVATRA